MSLSALFRSVRDDLRFAVRSLRRSPGFVVSASGSLGLAIGAGVAGFGVIDATRFRALPFPEADRLVLVSEIPPGGCPFTCDVNYRTLDLLQRNQFQTIDTLAAFFEGPNSLGTGEAQVDIRVGIVSAALFPLLGVKPVLGRTFSADEDRLGAVPTMVIAHDLWSGHFNGDPSILGKTFVLSDEPFTVIGVMPPGFDFETGSQAWLAASRYLDPSPGTARRSAFVLGPLAPGATPASLALELQGLEAAANEGRPERLKTTFGAAPLRTRYVRATQSRDLVLAAIVGCIVLIACANVGGLVLVRTVGSRRELAVRAAIGAGMPRIARDLFVQNLLLAMAGLAIGFVLAA